MLRMVRPILGVSLLAGWLDACSRPHSNLSAVRQLAGCYQFAWKVQDPRYSEMTLPDQVRLDSEPSCPTCERDAPAAQRMALRSVGPDTATYGIGSVLRWNHLYYASWWMSGPGDSITIVFNSNWTSWETRLKPSENTLEGTSRYWSDDGGSAIASVVATRMVCPR